MGLRNTALSPGAGAKVSTKCAPGSPLDWMPNEPETMLPVARVMSSTAPVGPVLAKGGAGQGGRARRAVVVAGVGFQGDIEQGVDVRRGHGHVSAQVQPAGAAQTGRRDIGPAKLEAVDPG